MGRISFVSLFTVIFLMIISGCAFHAMKHETGKPLDEDRISQIVKGKTTSAELLTWFGAPTTTSKLGDEELFIYKFCKTEGSRVAFTLFGQTSTKQKCNELTITLDKSTGKVKNYSYQKELED